MPTVRKHETCVINEWQLHEVADAFSVPVHPINTYHAETYGDGTKVKFRGDWHGGCDSLADARKLLTDGWHDGVKRLQTAVSEFNPPEAKTRKRVPMWRDDGDELSIDRAMRGQWDTAWRTSRRRVTRGPQTIELYTIYGGSAALSADQIFWNGAACVAIADRLESAGYAVRIVACFLHEGTEGDEDGQRGRVMRSDVVIKEASEPLRIDGVASVLCHAGVYRSFLFRTWITAPVRLNCGLGPAIYRWADHAVQAFKVAGEWPEGAIVIDQAYSKETCRARIAEVVGKVEATQDDQR